MRESNRELNALLRIAPHLVSPLPIAIPTYGHGMQSKELLRLALLAYNLITCDRNRGLKDPQRRIPRPRFISRQECLSLFPGLKREGLTGAVIFHDGHMYSPPRLALAYLKSAVNAGADAVNYVRGYRYFCGGEWCLWRSSARCPRREYAGNPRSARP